MWVVIIHNFTCFGWCIRIVVLVVFVHETTCLVEDCLQTTCTCINYLDDIQNTDSGDMVAYQDYYTNYPKVKSCDTMLRAHGIFLLVPPLCM